jgi:hypothetical protein
MLRHNNVVPSHNRVADEPVTVGVGDEALDIDPHEEGATFENPPNGGYRAWLIVLSCALINMLLSMMEMLIDVSILDLDMALETRIYEEQAEISYQFKSLVYLYGKFAFFCVCVCVCVRTCMHAYVGACVCVCVCVFGFVLERNHMGRANIYFIYNLNIGDLLFVY